ncbi:MAG: AAA family ATPase, partial [Deltaproteobacteria bacterium]|nr:AAA family ATPase [Deltaproteobacteria bacterium]
MEHSAAVIAFGPFRLAPDKRELWKDEVLLKVRAMPLTVLTYFAQHPERVIPIDEVRKAVWGGTRVGRGAVRVCVREIRQALGDEAATPRYVETVGRQGYRFIAPLATAPPVTSSQLSVASTDKTGEKIPQQATGNWSLTTRSRQLTTPFVGRQRELAQLQQWFTQVQQGQRQVVLVSGEPGIGKTTLIEVFLSTVHSPESLGENQKAKIEDQSPVPSPQHLTPSPWIGRGQCVESYGPGEAYLPVLEAFGRLGRELGTGKLTAVLYQHAPTWLAQLPGLVDTAARGALHRQVAGATQERMLRELCDALEVLTATQPLLLVLEDLQWSDTATLAWLAAVARRPDPARLFVIGAYRPIDVVAHTHPLRGLVQELRTHRLCREVRLELLSVDEVREYIRQWFASEATVDELGLRLHQRTDGNPLFLTASVDTLIQQGVVSKEGDRWEVHGDLATLDDMVPEDLQHLISKQLEALAAEDQQILEVASVSGVSFTTAEVAAGCHQELETIETRCEQLARRGQFIAEAGVTEWPDGTLTMNYHFRHALYQQGVYARLGGGQKVRLHRLIGERREAGYGERVREIAGELALHFEQGRDYGRAVRYRQVAAELALQRSGQHETITHCEKGLALLAHLPATPDRIRQELALRLPLAAAQLAVHGVAADESGQNLERARMLCREMSETAALIPVVIGLGRFYLTRAERTAVEELAEQERRLLERVHDPALALQLHIVLGGIEFCRGALGRAQEHFDQALTLFDAEQHKWLFLSFSGDPLTLILVHSSCSAWLSGRPDQARTYMERSFARAEEVSHPLTLVYALIIAAMAKLFLREPDEAGRLAQRGVSLAREHGFSPYTVLGAVVQSCAALQRGELKAELVPIAEALSAYRATGAQIFLPLFLAFLAEGYLQLGRIQDGLQVVTEALQLTEANFDRFWEAELYRLKGELVLQSGQAKTSQGKSGVRRPKSEDPNTQHLTPSTQSEAQACFQQALEIARSQGAKSLELRAVMSLSRLWHRQGKTASARQMLAEIYNWFTEGFDTQDL